MLLKAWICFLLVPPPHCTMQTSPGSHGAARFSVSSRLPVLGRLDTLGCACLMVTNGGLPVFTSRVDSLAFLSGLKLCVSRSVAVLLPQGPLSTRQELEFKFHCFVFIAVCCHIG